MAVPVTAVPKLWDSKTARLRCVGIREEAPDVRTFRFEAEDGSWFAYRPGQFVTLELPVGPQPVLRTYTLASTPSRPHHAKITTKVQPGSVATRWLFDHLKLGDRLTAHGPAGRFSLVDHPGDRYLFLSAGSGATPMMSMARWLFDTAPQTDVTYVHFARQPEDLLFRSELGYMAEAAAGLRLRFAVTGAPEGEGWSSGRLDPALLSVMCPDIADRTVFCCGPDRFMEAARRLAGDLGVPATRWHEESFGATPAPVPVVSPIAPSATEMAAAAGMQVVFTRSGRKAPLLPGQTILEAAEGCGLRIPTACRQGLCGTCLVRKLSGSVRMEHNGGIADDEIADGWILACCSEAESALVEVEV